MVKKITVPQQRALIKSLPTSSITSVKKHCKDCEMKGQGIGDILRSIKNFLGPIFKEVGPTVLKELVVPFIKKKMDGKGTSLAGKGTSLAGRGTSLAGGTLKLAGQGKKKRRKK